tara:strand:- start:3342 stop:4004 length:663 start_codon:yes stop_codon:yes gene_type:complete
MMHNLFESNSSAWYIIQGAWVTLQYAGASTLLGFILGIILSLFKLSHLRPLEYLARAYTSIFRGTPLLLQLSFIYFAIPALIGYEITAFEAGIAAFSLNSGAYISEIIRAGIQAIDKGQFEAAQSLGLSYLQMMRDIILPQSLKNILPALVNEMVNLLKESAIISTIGGADLMRRAQLVAADEYTYFGPLIIAGICYYTLVLILSSCAKLVENKLNTATA